MSVRLVTAPEVARDYGIPLRTVQEACKSDRLPCQRVGGKGLIMIKPRDAENFAKEWQERRNRRASSENQIRGE